MSRGDKRAKPVVFLAFANEQEAGAICANCPRNDRSGQSWRSLPLPVDNRRAGRRCFTHLGALDRLPTIGEDLPTPIRINGWP